MNGKLTTKLYDKWDGFICPSSTSFSMTLATFYLLMHMYLYFVLIRYAKPCPTYDHLWFETACWQTNWCLRDFYRQFSTNIKVVETMYNCRLPKQSSFRPVSFEYFIPLVKPFMTHFYWLQIVSLTWSGNWVHSECDRSTEYDYSSYTPDPTYRIFRDPCLPILYFHFLENLFWGLFVAYAIFKNYLICWLS
jgi:hypothetical protein